jgi:demethylspheroidene O-methyltransferase
VVASHRFQRWAAGFWLTRPLARRHASDLFDLVAGFVYTQVLAACVRLDLFERLGAQGPMTAAALAAACAMPERAMQRLLDAGVSIRLLERRSGARFGLGPLGAPMVGNAALKAMVEHHAALYADLRDPVALLRNEGAGSAMSAYWPYAAYPTPDALPSQRVAEYSALMTASQRCLALRAPSQGARCGGRGRALRRGACAAFPGPRTDAVRPAAGRGAGPRALGRPATA